MEAASGDGEIVVDFVLAPHWADPPYYRLYVEAANNLCESELARRMDEDLSRINLEYASKRASLRLGMVEAVALPPGALANRDQELRRLRAGTSEQYKHQYLLARPDMDGDLAGLSIRQVAHGDSTGRAAMGAA
jgi:hypothetical protein